MSEHILETGPAITPRAERAPAVSTPASAADRANTIELAMFMFIPLSVAILIAMFWSMLGMQ